MIRFDISKLVDEPRRSGIQRVERELIRHWPDRSQLLPCRFDGAEMRALPSGILDALCLDAPAGGIAAETVRLAPFLTEPGPVVARGRGTLFCAELFDDPARAAYHVEEAGSAAWLVYDFLPWLRPDWFPAGPANRLMPYLHAMRAVQRRGFISAATRRDCAAVFQRQEDGPVLPLGADGLGLERQRFDPARRDVVLLGTIEARKNAAAALEAAEILWREGLQFRLVLIGAVEPDALAEQAILRRMAGEARLVQLGAAPDAVVRESLRGARALLFPSEGEGFGLPPMKALYCGIPVIVASGLPALETVPALGQIKLSPPDVQGVTAALRTVLDDAAAARSWADAASVRLQTWRAFAADLAGWLG